MDAKLDEACRRLAALREVRPTPARWAEVEEGLGSKFEGLQVHAARVLGAWGGERAITMLRQWLLDQLARDAGWAAAGVAVQELGRCVGPEDAEWILNLYFDTPARQRHPLLQLATVLPRGLVEARVARERRSSDSSRRQAAAILARRISDEAGSPAAR